MHMSPIFTSHNSPNSTLGHIKNLRDFSLSCISKCIHLPDLKNIFINEFAGRINFSIKWGSFKISTLPHFVIYVVLMSSYKKMIRIYARRIIAMMTYAHSFGDRSTVKNPRRNIGTDWNRTLSTYLPISIKIQACRPNPAFGWRSFFDLLPESGCERGRKTLRGQIFSGNLNHSSVIASLGLRVRRGFFHYFTLGEKVNTL